MLCAGMTRFRCKDTYGYRPPQKKQYRPPPPGRNMSPHFTYYEAHCAKWRKIIIWKCKQDSDSQPSASRSTSSLGSGILPPLGVPLPFYTGNNSYVISVSGSCSRSPYLPRSWPPSSSPLSRSVCPPHSRSVSPPLSPYFPLSLYFTNLSLSTAEALLVCRHFTEHDILHSTRVVPETTLQDSDLFSIYLLPADSTSIIPLVAPRTWSMIVSFSKAAVSGHPGSWGHAPRYA